MKKLKIRTVGAILQKSAYIGSLFLLSTGAQAMIQSKSGDCISSGSLPISGESLNADKAVADLLSWPTFSELSELTPPVKSYTQQEADIKISEFKKRQKAERKAAKIEICKLLELRPPGPQDVLTPDEAAIEHDDTDEVDLTANGEFKITKNAEFSRARLTSSGQHTLESSSDSIDTNDVPKNKRKEPYSDLCTLKNIRNIQAHSHANQIAQYLRFRAETRDREREYAESASPNFHNRWGDVHPVEETRVKLASGAYINANEMDPEGRKPARYIGTQAPLIGKGTLDHFWEMAYEKKSNVIVNLVSDTDLRRRKGEVYWPTLVQSTKDFGNYRVVLDPKEPEDRKGNGIVVRTFHIIPLVEGKPDEKNSRTIKQVHYSVWPDKGVPESGGVQALVDVLKPLQSKDEPMIVHCSAGVGRTGTLIAALEIDQLKSKGVEVTPKVVVPIVLNLRKQRGGQTVQTSEQYDLLKVFAQKH
jgi:protein tyrosine phosphatase